jgi:hypothetical protein
MADSNLRLSDYGVAPCYIIIFWHALPLHVQYKVYQIIFFL